MSDTQDSESYRPDCGVAATGYVCQNEPEHPDDQPEVEMVSAGAGENGVICPECGRMSGGPDDEIPYGDPPYDRPGNSLSAWIEQNRSILEGNPTEYARGYETCLDRLETYIRERERSMRRSRDG